MSVCYKCEKRLPAGACRSVCQEWQIEEEMKLLKNKLVAAKKRQQYDYESVIKGRI